MGHLDRRGDFSSLFKMDMIRWLTLLIGVITLTTPARSANEPRVVCYYTNWSVYRPGNARFNPQNINPYLCTHLIYAFGGFTKDNTLKAFDKYQDIEKGGYAKFTGLKTYNKNLKTMLAIGGWNEGSSRFSPMVGARDRRKEFVRNAIKFLRQNKFDGLDLDWEYPAFRDGGKAKDRENYAKLVKELREEFEKESLKTGKPRLLLTMAVPAGIEYIEKGFDLQTLNQYLDWMNLLTYDYHSAFEPAVNHHAPLYPIEEPNEYSVDTELNIDYTIKFYLENGVDANKLVLGIPTYGRSYTLFNADAYEIGSPADGPGEQGDATREKGYLAYYEICEALKPKPAKKRSTEEDSEEYSEEEEEPEWTVMHPNPDAMGPVAFRGNQWVGYDDENIVKKKAEYVAENGLGGIMFWSIDNDDFRGTCHEKPYPLIEAAKEAYIAKLGTTDTNAIALKTTKTKSSGHRRRNRPKSSTTTTIKPSTEAKSNKRSSTTPSWNITPEPPTTPDPGSDFKCVDEGFFPHPRDCKKYFWCLDSGPSDLGIVAHSFTCPSGLFFNKAADSCDFARNVLCKTAAATTKAPTKAPTTKAPTTTVTTTTTTRKPVKLTSKNSAAFRTTTSTIAPEPESEEYEYVSSEDSLDEDAEDPRVIKELIDLIKKVGGIEQLEKQLHFSETSQVASTDGGSTTTPSPFNKKLYQKVLERARGKNKFPSNSIVQTSINSRRGPQNQGLDATADKDVLIKKDRPQYTTINRQRTIISTEEPPSVEEDSEENLPEPAPSRGRAVETSARGTTTKPLQYVNIRRARPSSDTADDTASRNALFERAETYVPVTELNSLDISGSRRENLPEYVTIRRQRPTTEETTTVQYQESEQEIEQGTALEREISSQPQYTSIVRARGTTVTVPDEPSTTEPSTSRFRTTTALPEEPSTPEPTTVLAVQISSLLNSPSPDEEAPETTVVLTTEQTTTTSTTTTTTTTPAPPSSSTRRNLLNRRRLPTTTTITTTTTPGPSSSTTQSARRTFLRRTKATSPPDTTEADTPAIDNDKSRRGSSRFKSRESARNETSSVTLRPSLNAPRRGDRPATRNFVRRRLVSNVTSTTTPAPVSKIPTASPLPAVTRRPFRIASRRRPNATTIISTTQATTVGSTIVLDSEESLQDIDIDAIEDPSLEPKTEKKVQKTPRRPLVNLKDEAKDQNPSATNEEESKRQSKKYSSNFRENQLVDILKKEEVTTSAGTTLEDYNAETVLAIATHQLITAPLPSTIDYDEGTKSTSPKYKETTYTNTPTYEYSTYKNPQDFVQTTAGEAFSYYDTPRETTIYDTKPTDFTTNSRPTYTATYEPSTYDTKTTEGEASQSTQGDFTTDAKTQVTDARTTDIEPKITFVTDYSTTAGTQYTNFPTYEQPRISTTFDVPKSTYEPSTDRFRYKTTFEPRETTSEPNTGILRYKTTFEPKETTSNLNTETLRYKTTFEPKETTSDSETLKYKTTFEPKETTSDLNTETLRYQTTINKETTLEPKTQGLRYRTFEPKQTTLEGKTETIRYSTPVYRSRTANQFVTTPQSTESTTSSPYFVESKSPRGFSAPNVITPGYSGLQRGGAKYQSNFVTTTEDVGYSTSGLRSSSKDPAYFTRDYLLESPVTKTYDEEYQYLSPTTPTTTQRKVFRKKIQRRISTTLRPTTPYAETTTLRPTRVSSKPFEKVTKAEPKEHKTYKPVVNYDYYDDSDERMALKYAEGTKVILHGKGSIECLDVGNFPHPSSCKKFISCARMEFGSLLGWEYVCPQGLSFDPVGGICNWSAGLGCDEKE